MFFFSFTDATFFCMFLILLICFNKQVLLKNLFFLELYMYSFRMRRMWFWNKQGWQLASRKPMMTACGVSGRRAESSFNFKL